MEARGYSRIGEIWLRNLHQIYESPSQYSVVQVDKHGGRQEQMVSKEVVDVIADLLDGEQVSVAGAFEILEPMVDQGLIHLPFSYGFKLHYFIQDVLLVLVAIGLADLRNSGRANLYNVSRK